MTITAAQLWAAVLRGETDIMIAWRAGLTSNRSVRKLRKRYGIPSARDLGTYDPKRDRDRDLEPCPLDPDDPGLSGERAIRLPSEAAEREWLARALREMRAG